MIVKKPKIVVYTAIFNNYDWLKEPVFPSPEIDFICYTDSDKLISKQWKIVKIDLGNESPSLKNREIKLLYPYTMLQDYDYSLYVDGSIMIKGKVQEFLSKYLHGKPLYNFQHPDNDCIFLEINNCINEGRGNAEKLKLQFERYKAEGTPEHYGLSDNKIILRANHNTLGKQIMFEWYNEVVNYSGRDQVCLSYVLYKHGLHYNFFDENIENNPYFETWPHNRDGKVQIWWRKLKWFFEKRGILTGFFKVLDNKLKPLFLKYYVK